MAHCLFFSFLSPSLSLHGLVVSLRPDSHWFSWSVLWHTSGIYLASCDTVDGRNPAPPINWWRTSSINSIAEFCTLRRWTSVPLHLGCRLETGRRDDGPGRFDSQHHFQVSIHNEDIWHRQAYGDAIAIWLAFAVSGWQDSLQISYEVVRISGDSFGKTVSFLLESSRSTKVRSVLPDQQASTGEIGEIYAERF